jgi:putative oxidoreductase
MRIPVARHDMFTSIGLLILRVGVSTLMVTHGWGKVTSIFSGKFAGFPDPIGMGNTLSLIFAAAGEFLCPILIAAGLFTRLAAIGPAFTMAIAAFVVHSADPWASREPALAYMIPFVALIFTGPGRVSLDHLLFARKRPQAE